MEHSSADISIIIVNYKVKEYIANLLNSIAKARHNKSLQIIVVDNDSGDNSIEFLRNRFPDVEYIGNKENLGFGKANNQAIKKAVGKYTLIINPDTLVSEDTFEVLTDHMNRNPECGACGCKILNPDGTFAPESRRSVPTIWTSITKVLGLNSLFPKSKLFGRYYLGWLHEDEASQIPVLSGSFMFWRTKLLKELEGFDERFFMYGEDIDLCYRIEETGFYIDYVPETSIIHYKGESTRKSDLRYIRIFNKALYQFFEKHYSSNYSFLFKIFIYASIWIKAITSVFTNNIRMIGFIASDLILLNISVVLGFLIRFKFHYEVFTNLQNLEFLWINVLASLIYVFVGGFLDLFRSQKDSISNQLKAITASYVGVAFITFFVRDYAFSRLALIIGFGIALVMMIVFRFIQINTSRNETKVTGKIKTSRVILVGSSTDTEEIKSKIHSRPDWNYEVIGKVTIDHDEDNVLGTLPQLKDLVKAYRADQVFFALKSISYKDMLLQISTLQGQGILFKLIPDSMDFILGKSNVEYLESIPLVEVGFAYSKGMNQLMKRLVDLFISLPVTFILFLFTFPALILSRKKKFVISDLSFYQDPASNKWKNRFLMFWYVVTGRMSLAGSPISSERSIQYDYKMGLTGSVQLNKSRINSLEDRENYELYYLQNYSVWMDIDILIKTIFNGSSATGELERSFKRD